MFRARVSVWIRIVNLDQYKFERVLIRPFMVTPRYRNDTTLCDLMSNFTKCVKMPVQPVIGIGIFPGW